MSSRTTPVILQPWNLDINMNLVPIIFHISLLVSSRERVGASLHQYVSFAAFELLHNCSSGDLILLPPGLGPLERARVVVSGKAAHELMTLQAVVLTRAKEDLKQHMGFSTPHKWHLVTDWGKEVKFSPKKRPPSMMIVMCEPYRGWGRLQGEEKTYNVEFLQRYPYGEFTVHHIWKEISQEETHSPSRTFLC